MKEFTLDMTGVLEDPKIQEDMPQINSRFKLALGGTYNPLFKEFERMYLENDNTPESRAALADAIRKNSPDIEIDTSLSQGYQKGFEGQLYFMLQGLENNKSISEIMDGYEYDNIHRPGINERGLDLFGGGAGDFNRTAVKVLDQDGNILYQDLHTEIYNSLPPEKRNTENYKKQLQEKLNLTDEQFKTYASRITQYSVTGNGLVFQPASVMLLATKREDILRVNTDGEGKISVQSFESTTRASAYDKQDGMPDLESDPKPFYTMSDKIYFPPSGGASSRGYNLILPSQKIEEVITFQAHQEEAQVIFPESLVARTVDNKKISNILLQEHPNREELSAILAKDNLDVCLTKDNMVLLAHSNLLNDEQRNKLVASFIKKEIDSLKKQNPEISNKETQDTLQNSINFLGNALRCKNQHFSVFKRHVGNYLSSGNSEDLSKAAEYTNNIILNATLQTQSIEKITADALGRDNKTIAELLTIDNLNQYLSREASLALCQNVLLRGQDIDIDEQYKNQVIENFIKDEIDRCCTKPTSRLGKTTLDREKLKLSVQTLTGLEPNSEKLNDFIEGAENYVKEKKPSILKTLSAYVRAWFQESQLEQGRESSEMLPREAFSQGKTTSLNVEQDRESLDTPPREASLATRPDLTTSLNIEKGRGSPTTVTFSSLRDSLSEASKKAPTNNIFPDVTRQSKDQKVR